MNAILTQFLGVFAAYGALSHKLLGEGFLRLNWMSQSGNM